MEKQWLISHFLCFSSIEPSITNVLSLHYENEHCNQFDTDLVNIVNMNLATRILSPFLICTLSKCTKCNYEARDLQTVLWQQTRHAQIQQQQKNNEFFFIFIKS